jgi:DNA mismatch endonuclease (patch repair protein)
MDIVSTDVRSRMMSGIRSKDTGIEMRVRRLIHGAGFRYRLHAKDLPGRPDIVLPKHGAVIQVNGCFWHRHGCSLFKLPSTNTALWREKLDRNYIRDLKTRVALEKAGWRLLIVWECALRLGDIQEEEVGDLIIDWLDSSATSGDLRYSDGSAVILE